MAVTFISYGYDTVPGDGLSETVWQEMFHVIGSASYGVRSPLDWKVTAVTGADRTVSIAAGRGFGLGVIDKTVDNDTIQLDPITSGTRWDLIACRRDPTPTAGVSEFVAISGGATPVIPGGRLVGPGIHDQPLYLVQVTAGQTQPTGFIDLRTWVGDGGGFVGNHDLVRSFLNKAGTRINILGLDWLRRVGANDTNEWVQLGDATVADVPWTTLATTQGFTHFTGSGWTGLKYAVKNGWVTINGAVARPSAWPADYTCAVIPSAYKPAHKIQGTGTGQIEPTAGNITLAAGSGSTSFSITYPLS